MSKSSKSLGVRQNEIARKVVRELLDSQYDGNQVAMAAACGVSQSTISNLISGKHGMGPKVLLALIRVHPAAAMRAMGIEISESGYPIGETASAAIEELERDGYSREVATWAVVTACKFGTSDNNADAIVAMGRVIARFAEAIEMLSGPRPGGPAQTPERKR